MAAEFLAPTTRTSMVVIRMGLFVIVDDFGQVFAGDIQ